MNILEVKISDKVIIIFLGLISKIDCWVRGIYTLIYIKKLLTGFSPEKIILDASQTHARMSFPGTRANTGHLVNCYLPWQF